MPFELLDYTTGMREASLFACGDSYGGKHLLHGGNGFRSRKTHSELKDVDENEVLIVNGRSGRTRTCDPLLRRQMLYPAELRSHVPEIPVLLL